MTELFTMIVLAANIVVASAFARFALAAAANVATAHEQPSDADTFEGRVVARIRVRDARSAVSRDIGESVDAYWGSPLF
ncbi:MAG TPA: hypothetical protein VGM09_28970 [Bradyrhizobium sp.]|jgi:hypothetical protein